MGEAKRRAGPMPYDRVLVNDLTIHAWSQIEPVIKRVVDLADTPETAMQVAILLLGKVAGATGGVTAFAYDMSDTLDSMRQATLTVLDLAREITADGAEAFIAKTASGVPS